MISVKCNKVILRAPIFYGVVAPKYVLGRERERIINASGVPPKTA